MMTFLLRVIMTVLCDGDAFQCTSDSNARQSISHDHQQSCTIQMVPWQLPPASQLRP